MIVTTTSEIDGRQIAEHHGVVVGEVVAGANILRDILARLVDIFGGRARSYERKLKQTREAALLEMQTEAQKRGADAVVGVRLDYEMLGRTMLMVSAVGTAVRLKT